MSKLKILSWNINRQEKCWEILKHSGVDCAILQEAKAPPVHLRHSVLYEIKPALPKGQQWWVTTAALSDEIIYKTIPTQPLGGDNPDALMVSRPGTISAAEIIIKETGEKIIIVSLYANWANPLGSSKYIYADASAHRLISDLSALIDQKKEHKIIAAGDLNILYGYGERGNYYWKKRYDTVFNRMEVLGLKYVGPQAPGGLQTDPWPDELPEDSKNVPTYRTNKDRPETASRQLDHVFVSESIADRIRVRAMNSPEEWGPSDHCRLLIELKEIRCDTNK